MLQGNKITLASIGERVALLEERQAVMENDVIEMRKTQLDIVDNTSEILSVLTASKKVTRIARRWISPVIAAACTAGFFNPKVSAFLTTLFN